MIERILEKVSKKADQAEVCFSESETVEINFEAGILKSAETIKSTGISLRVIKDGKIGFCASSDLSRVDDMIEKAVESSKFGKEAKFSFPSKTEYRDIKLFDPAIENFSPEAGIAEGKKAVEMLKEKCPKGLTDISVSSSVEKFRLMNTSGFDAAYSSTELDHSIVSVIVEGDSILWISDGGNYGSLELKTEEYVEKIAGLAAKTKKKARKVSGIMPVIFVSDEMGNLLESVEMGVDGLRYLKGDSPLINREGEKLLGDITITDDPFIDFGPGSRPFDDEAVASMKNVLFENGIFRSFIFDLDTGANAGKSSTGNATRGNLSSPGIDTSNLVMSKGSSKLEEMIAGLDDGIIVYGVLGGGQSNMLAGDFALNIMLGFHINKGEISGRVADTMVSGNVYDAFGKIAMLGDKQKPSGNIYAPDVLFSELSVSSV